jgi:alkylated DNA repair protein (DNA oxidative demethylase)
MRSDQPEGLRYQPEFVSEDEERQLLAWIDTVDFREVVMHGQPARRTVRHYGYGYDYDSWKLQPADPLPPELYWLRDRCADYAGVAATDFAEALITRYPPGATIGWHRDAPVFGANVAGVSLLSSCRMRFQRGKGEQRRVFELELAPRSVYILAGDARFAWQHSIPPTKGLRFSVTFRTVRS